MQWRKLFQADQWRLWLPIRHWRANSGAWPDSTPAHVLAHLLPAPVMVGGVYGLWLVAQHDPLLAACLAVIALQVWWQFDLEERHSTAGMNLPVWSMVWDTITTAAAALLTWQVCR